MGGSYIEDWNLLVPQHSQFYNQPEYKIQALWENYFSEIFGFKKILNEIDSQRKLHIGSTDREIPDIILNNDGRDLFIVELKQYSFSKNDDFEKQLLNYMSHTDLRLSIGILVCEKLYLYFYNHSDNKNDCLEIPFEKDNELGIKLMELFNKNNFDIEKTRDFIQSESKKKNDVSKIKKEISEELVKNLLTEHFIKTYDKDVVESALKGFSFICSERKNMNTGASAVVQNSSVPFTSSGKNNAQFTVNGVPTGGKCPTVRYVIESYVKNNPGITFEQLQEAFPDEAARPGFGKVVRRLEDVKVYIEDRGKTYEYFMTDDIDVLFRKLNSLGYRNVKESDWRLNSSLAKSVRNKMTELGCRFSMTFSHGTSVLNFWAKNSTRPYFVNLDELLPLDSVLKRQMSRIKESITGTENFKKLAERNSWTPLMMAVMMNSRESAKEYIAEGFDVNCSDKDGITPLMIAVSNRNKEMVELLIKNGADVNYCTNRGTSILLLAIMNNKDDLYTEIIKILRDAGARTDNICLNSKTPEAKLTFNQTLEYFISQFTLNGRGKQSLIYKNTSIGGEGGIDKRAFSKIRSQKNPNYHPKKNTVFLLALGMNLTVEQTEQLLFSAGYAFDEKNKFDMTIKDFIQKRNFRIEEIENALFEATGKYLGQKEDSEK